MNILSQRKTSKKKGRDIASVLGTVLRKSAAKEGTIEGKYRVIEKIFTKYSFPSESPKNFVFLSYRLNDLLWKSTILEKSLMHMDEKSRFLQKLHDTISEYFLSTDSRRILQETVEAWFQGTIGYEKVEMLLKHYRASGFSFPYLTTSSFYLSFVQQMRCIIATWGWEGNHGCN